MKYITAIIPAAGNGSRMASKEKKQYMKLDKKEILIRTIEKFEKCNLINDIIVVTSQDEVDRCKELIAKYNIKKVVKVVCGGERRQDSIYNALQEVSHESDIVLVHDAARPFVSEKIIIDNINEVSDKVGVITAVASKDTIKVIKNGFVEETLDRSKLINVQTPQTFNYKTLVKAYDYMVKHDLDVTDDSSLMESIGVKIKVITGSYDNIKITTPDDLLIGELILKRGN